jgi:uncharacterized protein
LYRQQLVGLGGLVEILKRLGINSFEPIPFLKSGRAQTVAAAFWPTLPDRIPKNVEDVLLDDGDVLKIVENKPYRWTEGDRIVVLVHGLGGHHQSNYMIRLAEDLYRAGVLVVRVNLRGCGIGFGYAKNPYHSGRSEDIRSVLKWLSRKYSSPVTIVGFSLGANIVLKLAGEDANRPTGGLDSVIAVSPPVNLFETADHLCNSKNILFDQFFVWKLRYDIRRFHKKYPEVPLAKIPMRISLTDIDEYYTAPRSGFNGAKDYYTRASSGQFVPAVSIRGLILSADDDPIVDTSSLHRVEVPSNIDLVLTKQGGHVGFLARSRNPARVQWMDNLIVKWIHSL